MADRNGFALACTCGERLNVRPSRELGCPSCHRVYEWRDGVLIRDDLMPAEDDYPSNLYDLLAAVEDRHFWFTTRNAIIADMVRQIEDPVGRSVLDVGCGTGVVLSGLERAGMRTCGVDMHLTGLTYARRRVSGLLVRSGAAMVPFPRQFDWVVLCDVIEHLDDDVACLANAASVVRPGRHLLVTVPADPRSWSRYDEVIGHKRRYSLRTLAEAITQAGLEVRRVHHFNAPLVLVQKAHRRMTAGRVDADGSDRQAVVRGALRIPPPPFNWLFGVVSAFERRVCRLAFPFGASLIAVGQQPGG